MSKLTGIATALVAQAHVTHGACVLSCDCTGWEVSIDSLTLNDGEQISKVVDLIEHARYDHAVPYNVIATKSSVVFDTRGL